MSRRLRATTETKTPTGRREPAATVQAPDPEAWSLARLYADGDTRRLQVIDHRTIRVLNRPA